MFWAISKRELTHNLVEPRFFIMLVGTVLLFAVSGWISTAASTERLRQHDQYTSLEAQRLRDNSTSLRRLVDHQQTLYLKPSPLEFAVAGDGPGMPDAVQMSARYVATDKPVVALASLNPVIQRFAPVDWAFIIGVVLSFGVVVFAYNSISGEKEQGTLALILTHPVKRGTLLLGKFTGIYATIAFPLLAGVTVNLLVVGLRSGLPTAIGFWARITLLLLVSLVYLAAFLMLGMMVSALTHSSTVSFVALFFIWTLCVVVIPEIGDTVGRLLRPVNNSSQLAILAEKAVEDVDNKYKGSESGVNFSQPFSSQTRTWVEFNNERMDAPRKIYDEHLRSLLAEASAARAFSRLSPTCAFAYAMESASGLGLDRTKQFFASARQYQRELEQFIIDQDKMDANSPHLLFSAFLSRKPVDVNSVPLPRMADLDPRQSVQNTLTDAAIILVVRLLALVTAYISFLRYDAR